ncbi:hypothetical protein O0I10_013096 [Lichtheimia ornata]|uniref:Uncharacterized protein n=1 Tax=Lichtheimia ornata TaxID=688661 RepID=A0AAD7UQ76_9FUNG|nr:uncharacterized protein O0I10_013096 [Lichtheimia ornata]KAJ8651378.1 hypothetical protein O0I10_013096 [Lichtheimia ornata]
MANPIELEDEDQHLNLVVVVKDTVSMVLEISYLQVVSLSIDLQSNVLSVPLRISHLKYLYGYLGCSLGFSRMLFIKTGFICCSA